MTDELYMISPELVGEQPDERPPDRIAPELLGILVFSSAFLDMWD